MADKKISQLTALAASSVAPSTDVLAIVDSSATETKKITAKDVVDGALNAGTANGVLYLNGSKEATSGSAFVFDGTNVGIGTSSPSRLLDIATSNAGGSTLVSLVSATDGNCQLLFGDTASDTQGKVFYDNVSDYMTLNTNGSERLRIDSSGNVGIGTASPATLLHVNSGANGEILRIQGADAQLRIDNTTANVMNINSSGSGDSLGFSTSDIERMRLTSTGLGIGTSSPAYPLQVRRAGGAGSLGISIDSVGSTDRTVQYFAIQDDATGVGAGHAFYYRAPSSTTNTLGVLLDESGNLGLGVTPSAWSSPDFRGLQVGSGIALYGRGSGDADRGGLSANAYHDGTAWKYIATGNATDYYQADGSHTWSTAGSGTAGNAITFTQAMTLDASGNLGVGETSPDTRAHIYGANTAGRGQLYIQSSGTVSRFVMANSSDAQALNTYGDSSTSLVTWDAGSGYSFRWTVADTERARITSAGNLGIGTTNPVYPLVVSAAGAQGLEFDATAVSSAPIIQAYNRSSSAYIQLTYSALQHVWQTSGTERARITSGGDFGVGTASPSSRFHAQGGAAAEITTTQNTNASTPYGHFIYFNAAAPNNATQWFIKCQDNAAIRTEIRSNGGLANYQSNNVDLSDIRTKKDIAPAASMWDKIGALEIVTYKYNDQTHEDVNVGVIAQQVESVEPVWVDADGFGETPEGEEPLKTVYTKDITFAAIKALQEAMTRIEELEAKVAALEAA